MVLFSAIFAGICSVACVGLVLRFGYVRAKPRVLAMVKPSETDWQAIFSDPIPPYTTFGRIENEDDPEVSDGAESHMAGDTDLRVSMARMEEQIRGLKSENHQLGVNVERGFKTLSDNLGKNADALQTAFSNFRNDFVSKTEYATLSFQVKMLWGVACALGMLVLLMVARALFSGLTLGS